MATLTSTITATQQLIGLTGSVTAAVPGRLYRIEDEIVLLVTFEDVPAQAGQVRPIGLDHASWIVQRGFEGTTPATHTSGTTVYGTRDGYGTGTSLVEPSAIVTGGGAASPLAEVLAASPAAYAGVARVIGPFAVAWNTAGFVDPADDGPVLVTLPAGTLIWPVQVYTTVAWDQGGFVRAMVGQGSNLNTIPLNPDYRVAGPTGNAWMSVPEDAANTSLGGGPQDQGLLFRPWLALQNSVLAVGFYSDSTPPSAGAADIYALVQFPS